MIKDVVFSEFYGSKVDRIINVTFENGVTYGMHQMMHLIEQFEDKKIPVTSDGIRKYFEEMKQQRESDLQKTKEVILGEKKKEITDTNVLSLFPKKD